VLNFIDASSIHNLVGLNGRVSWRSPVPTFPEASSAFISRGLECIICLEAPSAHTQLDFLVHCFGEALIHILRRLILLIQTEHLNPMLN
jgi:hypothetical protein